mmetsp:Transcript_16467/g.19781  ORF Transcript_16467/g.19781 Transcript_16467/m.19781 type:complete len:111 (+) Transcript_16467:47-379(+)
MSSTEFFATFRDFVSDFVKSLPVEHKERTTQRFTISKKAIGKKIGVAGQKGKGLDAVIDAIRMGPVLKSKKKSQKNSKGIKDQRGNDNGAPRQIDFRSVLGKKKGSRRQN